MGFKGSKVQFGDLYASGFLSGGSNPIGDGVRVQDVKQSFGQGNISFTDNGLDMAISGDGFFILNNNGETRYSRAGQFGIDKDGFITNNQNMKVQGYTADGDGNLSGIRGDLQIETDNLAPRRTTNLRSDLNLDSRESVLEARVNRLGEVSVEDLIANGGDEFVIVYADGRPSQQVQIPAQVDDGAGGTRDISAREIAGILNDLTGVSASATSSFQFEGDGGGVSTLDTALANPDFSFTIAIDGQNVPVAANGVSSKQELVDAINSSSSSSLSAQLVDAVDVNGDPILDGGGNPVQDVRIIDNRGSDLTVSYGNGGTLTDYDKVGDLNVSTDRSIQDIVTTDPDDPAVTSLSCSGLRYW